MNVIIPAIIPQSFEHLDDALRIAGEFTHEVQIDIVDGHFVPFTSWPYRGGGSVMLLSKYASTFEIEVDLMIAEPEKALLLYIEAGVQKVIVHLESVTNLNTILSHHASHHYELGFSIRNDTPLSTLSDVIEKADYIQLMGIRNIGSQGQPFDTKVLSRIKILRESYPELLISIDGSVNAETLPQLRALGANRFISGSAIFDATSPEQAFKVLSNI